MALEEPEVRAGRNVEELAAAPLSQHKPPHENAADQQHEQHDGDHADHVEQVLRLLVRGGLLPVRLLKLLLRLSAG